MEKVRPWCGQPSDRGRLRNRTEQNSSWVPDIQVWCTLLLVKLSLVYRKQPMFTMSQKWPVGKLPYLQQLYVCHSEISSYHLLLIGMHYFPPYARWSCLWIVFHIFCLAIAFSSLTLLVAYLSCKKIEWWGTGMGICVGRGANDLHYGPADALPPHYLLLH